MKDIWIFAEQINGVIQSSYYELLSKARELYPEERLTAVVLGRDNSGVLPALQSSGADAVISLAHEKLAAYHPDYFSHALVRLVQTYQPEIFLVSATTVGTELAPSVAAKLGTGLAAHCADLCLGENGELVTIIPAFGGKLLGEILIPEKRPVMATVKPGVFPRRELAPAENVSATHEDTAFLDEYTSRITLTEVQPDEVRQGKLEDAEIVVCVGLGIGSHENWDKANRLASLLRGSLGYTRPMVDMGYVDHENAMIGTSGKMIHPKLYIGFGISGATHHVCGMKDSATIISVNTNEKAAIFDVSDYKLVGDCGAVLDELLTLLES